MSVLVKGMEMPKDCLMCPFHGFGDYKGESIVCALTGRSEGQLSNVPDCPLVEVPFPHGRLIDADDAFIDADERGCDFWSCDADIDSAQDFLRAQPTIIEAEEGEDE